MSLSCDPHCRRAALAVAGALIALCFATGCSTFPRDFQAAAAHPAPQDTIAGPWSGEWHSDGGHRGALLCILSPISSTTPTQQYRARFEAKFWKLFTAHYDVTLYATPGADDAIQLVGNQDLGWLAGGVYHYEATVTPRAFDATYHCKWDTGQFHLTRPSTR